MVNLTSCQIPNIIVTDTPTNIAQLLLLPIEIKAEIFKHLPVPHFSKIARVCKLFRQVIIHSQLLWKYKYQEVRIDEPQTCPDFRQLFKEKTDLKTFMNGQIVVLLKNHNPILCDINLDHDDLTGGILKKLIITELNKKKYLKPEKISSDLENVQIYLPSGGLVKHDNVLVKQQCVHAYDRDSKLKNNKIKVFVER